MKRDTKEILGRLKSQNRQIFDLENWLRIHHPNILLEYEQGQNINIQE